MSNNICRIHDCVMDEERWYLGDGEYDSALVCSECRDWDRTLADLEDAAHVMEEYLYTVMEDAAHGDEDAEEYLNMHGYPMHGPALPVLTLMDVARYISMLYIKEGDVKVTPLAGGHSYEEAMEIHDMVVEYPQANYRTPSMRCVCGCEYTPKQQADTTGWCELG